MNIQEKLLTKQVEYWKELFKEVGMKYNNLKAENEKLKEENTAAIELIDFVCKFSWEARLIIDRVIKKQQEKREG